MHIVIYHNKNEGSSFFNGYTEGDPLVLKYEGDQHMYRLLQPLGVMTGTRQDVLEQIFKQNQHLGDKPWYTGRSLSVGDIIVIDGDTYAIERVGFKRLPVMKFNISKEK
jgi:hypothetical protein